MSLIGRFEHLPRRPRSDEAGPLLEKIASQVKPIMAKRGWKVGTLAEFLPSNPALLGNNMNHGQRINLRLRPPGAETTFYEYDQLVLVMLHELTHIQHGPHDANFYRLLAELEEEYYDLKRKGYSGDGFHSDGKHLAGIKRDEYEGRRVGLAAAEKRLAIQRKIGKGGVLGGSSASGKSIREVLAEAAERRIRDDKACAAKGSAEVDAEVRKAAEESVGVDAVDLTGSSDDEASGGRTAERAVSPTKRHKSDNRLPGALHERAPSASESRVNGKPIGRAESDDKAGISEQSIAGPSKPKIPSPAAGQAAHVAQSSDGQATRPSSSKVTHAAASRPVVVRTTSPPLDTSQTVAEWACPTCTLLNPIRHLSCDACATERPARYNSAAASRAGNDPPAANTGSNGLGTAEGWYCGTCGEGPIEWEKWSCRECGVVRNFG